MRYLLTSLLCVFTLSLTAQEACPNVFDYDNDGNVAVNDFLAMLGYFGDTDADSDGVWDSEDDCLDLEACNYSANPSEICEYFDVIGVCGGFCIEDADEDGVCDFDCGDQIGHQGYAYSTVEIGNQCWFSENCRYLPSVSPSIEGSDSEPYYYVYDYQGTDVTTAQSTSNYSTYGVLYNWPAAITEGLCPSGWHVPSDGEFTPLTDYLGGVSVAGNAMKSTTGWNDYNGSSGNGSNSSGFTGIPGGNRNSFGDFTSINVYSTFWSSSAQGSYYAWFRTLSYNNSDVGRSSQSQFSAYSVRCLLD
jgi:uncharacterized protein (TIGR02145 family)|tara:strand:+ start:442 stop:1353 length:912 start_codon:yes stop_codon:yes gene_type:complete